ncbi:MAG: DNA polymerase IV [bacterium]|nr:DNA polymerase IV [bacterium]
MSEQEQITRKIIHVDMDAFYASVEQRDNPQLKGKPVIVGGDPTKRGVVCTCSYEARKFGVRSAMAASTAYRLCPNGIFVRPRFDVYKQASNQIREIFHRYTDLVEPLSLDEAFLDVTENKKNIPYATDIAREILKAIQDETQLTASAGVSFNKFIAKVASDFNKPNGLTVITPRMAEVFIERLPIGKFFGVGKVTEKKMHAMGIKTGADLKKLKKEELTQRFGKAGSYYYNIVHGIDNRPVNPHRTRKSIGKETTLSIDIDDKEQMLEILEKLADGIEKIMKKTKTKGRTITLKVKYFDFKSITRSISLETPCNDASEIMKCMPDLLEKTEAGEKKIRLLGISVSNFESNDTEKKIDPQRNSLALQ